MRVVIDACIDPRLVEAFPDHQVQTLFDLGWQDLKDHELVKQLACDVFITADRGFEHQHNLESLSFGIVIVHVARNKISVYRPLFPMLLQAVEDNQTRQRGSRLRPSRGLNAVACDPITFIAAADLCTPVAGPVRVFDAGTGVRIGCGVQSPACCRRAGKHHCSMAAQGAGKPQLIRLDKSQMQFPHPV